MNLVLTIVHKLDYSELATFVESVRQTTPDAELVFFVAGTSAETARRLQARGVRVLPYRYFSIRMRQPSLLLWPLWKRRLADLPDVESKRRLARRVFNLFFLRWLLYDDLLAVEGDRYSQVLMTDCRDVVLQSDPFREQQGEIDFFLEAPRLTIGTCPINRSMILNCFNDQVLADLSAERIACAGTTLGSVPAVRRYLGRMVDESCQLGRMAMVPRDDQGLHNYIVHRGKLPGARIVENGVGAVLTMGALRPDEIHRNSEGQVTRPDGSVIPVLHQYDRHRGELAGRIRARYAG
jgi:hypothetical protein